MNDDAQLGGSEPVGGWPVDGALAFVPRERGKPQEAQGDQLAEALIERSETTLTSATLGATAARNVSVRHHGIEAT